MPARRADLAAAASGDPAVAVLARRATFPPPGTSLVCAVSGGPDSSALLVLAVAAGCRATAVHVDHGLRPGSAAEAGVVEALAARVGAGFESVRVEVGPGPNLEARARRARHEALPADAAFGHTADDQAETILLNLMRGSGVTGLAGMRPGPRHPLLALRRADTVALCRRLGIETVDDPTNAQARFLRNRVRHELLPLMADLSGRDPVPVLCRQAGHLRAVAELLESQAEAVDATDVAALRRAPGPVAATALRAWLRAAGEGHPPDSATLGRVLAVVRGEARATEVAGGARLARRGGRLRLEGPGGPRPPRSEGPDGRGETSPGRGDQAGEGD